MPVDRCRRDTTARAFEPRTNAGAHGRRALACPTGTLSASRGTRWSRKALRIELVATVDRPFQVKNGASGIGDSEALLTKCGVGAQPAARRGPNGTSRLLPNLLLRTSSTSRCRSTSPHCRRETSPMRSPRPASSAKIVAYVGPRCRPACHRAARPRNRGSGGSSLDRRGTAGAGLTAVEAAWSRVRSASSCWSIIQSNSRRTTPKRLL